MARKRKGIPALAAAFSVIAADSSTLESKADHVLAIVRTSGIRDEKSFSVAVREAYKANGWNSRQGKPARGKRALQPVPATVKQYVSIVRGAFRLGINVLKMDTFFKLRKTLREARIAARPQAIPTDPRMAGLRLVKSNELIGAPFHDLTVIYEKSGKTQQRQIAAEVKALAARFQPAAAPALVLAKAA
jgi:hypothetical protein